jgi:hypothetical protein
MKSKQRKSPRFPADVIIQLLIPFAFDDDEQRPLAITVPWRLDANMVPSHTEQGSMH